MAHLVRLCLRQPLLAVVAALLLALAGVYAFLNLPIDAFPDVSSTQVEIIMKAPGMTPEEVENRIVAPIELEMLGIPKQRMLRSVSKVAIADITIDFHEGTDIYWARQQVNERLNNVVGDLPDGVTGGLAPITTPLGEMFMFTIEGGELSLAERRTLLDWTIRPRLRTVPGVADVNSLGGYVRTFEVVPDPAALAARGMPLAELERALRVNNRNDGAGRLADGEEALLVRAEGSIRTLDDVRAIVIGERSAIPVRIGEVAEVRIGTLTRYGFVTRDGKGEAVQGLVLGLRGANARQVVTGVRARLAELAPALPPGVQVDVFYDRARLVDRAVGTVSKALLEAIVLVVVLLLLFLGDLRAAVVVAATLPLAALTTFILMQQAGMSANLMSLGGLAIAIGMLVDASVVVVENIVNRLAHEGAAAAKSRMVLQAVQEVAVPVAAGIAIIVIVFLPLLTLEGLEGKLFKPVAWAIIFALSGSLLLSLTVIPVLASLLLRPRAHREPWLMRVLQRGYRPVLAFALAHERTVAVVAGVFLAGAGAAYFATGKTFMPTLDEGDLIMQLEALPSIGIEASASQNIAIQKAILTQVPEVTRVVARTGTDELGLDPMGLNQSDVFMDLKPRAEWRTRDKQDIVESVRRVMAAFPGIDYTFTQPIEMRVSEMLTGVRGQLAVKIFGSDLGTLDHLSREVEAVLKSVPGNRDVFRVTNEGFQYLRVDINRFATGHQKLTVDEIEDDLRAQIEGRRVGTVIEGHRRTPLVIRGPGDLRASAPLFQNQNIVMPDGRAVPLGTVATLTRIDGPVKIDRENASRYAMVQAGVLGRDLVGFVGEAQRMIAERVLLPDGYAVSWGGQFENQQRAARRLAVVIPIALALIVTVLYTTFGSLRQTALVVANIPFALVGGIVALWWSGQYLSVPASVGFIALLGIAVLNGVVLMSTFNQLRAAGLAAEQVAIEGAQRRLRPVLMTASIAAFGLVPLLFATGPGSEIQRPLAIVVIGGLVTSTALTLVILPLLYRRFGDTSAPAAGHLPQDTP